jgi:hypothetical protein
MATVVLQYAGAAVGTLIGGPIGGIIGRAAGAIAGSFIDQRLFGPGDKKIEGPRLNDLRVMASEEGAPIPVIYGRMRMSGQVIWATNLEEVVETDTESASGKGGGPKTTTTEYSYFANVAIGLCEGPIDGIGRVWADGKEIDIATFTTRLYRGTETQLPDSLISAIEDDEAPAYRGLAYIVFERLPLANFGNRLPQLSFEILRNGNGAADLVRGVTIIPGSTEFGYDTKIVTRNGDQGETQSENAHMSGLRSDWDISLDQLQGTARNLDSVSLVVAWFGNDLRCGNCFVKPGVEVTNKATTEDWVVSGIGRAQAHVVSQVDGGPAYGGTPSDASVIRAIQDLRARGLKVVFYPFIMMDVAANNTLPDPYGGTAQPPYPWRGRITSSIAPGLPGSPDKTAAVGPQIGNFVGTAQPFDFAPSGTTITYSGPSEWTFRRMILHYAKLCAAAGGVDAFLIGSELRGLTTLRASQSAFPFVIALDQLASEVKDILPGAKVSYAADWSEYFGYQPPDGTNDVYFHLDPLWSSPDVDFIGIDNYMPLSDWRDGENHLDYLQANRSIYDLDYLKSQVMGGEGYDYFYMSRANRDTQTRTSITDGAYGKPWVFRYKDLTGWWSNQHRNRPGGVEQGTPTAWVPQSKPIWFTEAGCPAADKGTNSPNLFIDAKSSESFLPPYSGGQQDDLIQNRYILALQSFWNDDGPHNPVSSVYGGKMLDPARIFYWTWDSRPFPAFPMLSDVWSDAANYTRGHWLTGRLGSVDLRDLIKRIAKLFGFTSVDVSQVEGLVDGFVIDRPMSARDALEGLLQAFCIDAIESRGKLIFRTRKISPVVTLNAADMIDSAADKPVMQTSRAQETELPRAVRMVYGESGLDYRSAAVTQSRPGAGSSREITLSLPAAVSQHLAQARTDILLEEAWTQRGTAEFALPASMLALEPGDVVETASGERWRIAAISDADARRINAQAFDRNAYEPPPARGRLIAGKAQAVFGKPAIVVMDLAAVRDNATTAPWFAAYAKPWPGKLALMRQTGATSFALNRTINFRAAIGVTTNPLFTGLRHRRDFMQSLDVRMLNGALASVSTEQLLAGANVAAIGTSDTGFEIVQFQFAELVGPKLYRLTGLLRAQAGSDAEMLAERGAGAYFVLLNGAIVQPKLSQEEAGLVQTWRVGPARYDHAHPSYAEVTFDGELKSLRSYSPAQLRLRRDPAGLALSWIRRTRINGDSWNVTEVPLGEELEQYLLEILNGATVVRSITLATSDYIYSTPNMTADFGAPQTSLTFRVAQVSATTGAGPFTQRTLHA